jgi:hypothetical protein
MASKRGAWSFPLFGSGNLCSAKYKHISLTKPALGTEKSEQRLIIRKSDDFGTEEQISPKSVPTDENVDDWANGRDLVLSVKVTSLPSNVISQFDKPFDLNEGPMKAMSLFIC